LTLSSSTPSITGSPGSPIKNKKEKDKDGSEEEAKTIPPTEWFSYITGLSEPEFRKMDKSQIFKKNEQGYLDLYHHTTGKPTMCGQLSILRVEDLISTLPDTITPEKSVPIEIITREDNDAESIRFVDVAYYQSVYGSTGTSDTVFQVASNFNGIEAINDDIYPDVQSFVEQYIYDRTQGPVASISAGGAAIARVHAAFFDTSEKDWMQTKEHQINIIEELHEYLPTHNGYIRFSGNEKELPQSDKEKDELFRKMHVCYHENVQVTSGHRTAQSIEILKKPKYIDQVFCAAINIHQGESGRFNKTLPHINDSCQFILNSAYNSTYLVTVAKKKKHLYLTLIGGGAFGNSRKWIFDAILNAHLKYTKNPDCAIEKVTILLFRLGELEPSFLDDLEKHKIPHKLVVYSKAQPETKKSFP
jgi:hypothetical protein